MTKQEFVEAYRHEFCGMIADAVTTAKGGSELSMRLRSWFTRVDVLLAQAYEKAQPVYVNEPPKGKR